GRWVVFVEELQGRPPLPFGSCSNGEAATDDRQATQTKTRAGGTARASLGGAVLGVLEFVSARDDDASVGGQRVVVGHLGIGGRGGAPRQAAEGIGGERGRKQRGDDRGADDGEGADHEGQGAHGAGSTV